jgi:hypothetical protein
MADEYIKTRLLVAANYTTRAINAALDAQAELALLSTPPPELKQLLAAIEEAAERARQALRDAAGVNG